MQRSAAQRSAAQCRGWFLLRAWARSSTSSNDFCLVLVVVVVVVFAHLPEQPLTLPSPFLLLYLWFQRLSPPALLLDVHYVNHDRCLLDRTKTRNARRRMDRPLRQRRRVDHLL